MLLDPYGMQVDWSTIEAIAKTKAIDLWILFTIGVAVNRLLRKDGKLNKSVKDKLDNFFGSLDWIEAFYTIEQKDTLFGQHKESKKVVDFDGISNYFVRRLKKIFVGVAENPLRLYNSKNNPLYLLCFAASNKRGAKPALKIANYILK